MMEIDDFNDKVINMEARLMQNRLDKELLIEETFIAWYILVEGIFCESFSESDIKDILRRNVTSYQNTYANDADYNFIIGWMLTVAFWYFAPLLKEEDGARLLDKAYRSNPKNSLFKWALRGELRLKDDEIKNLKIDIASRYDEFYNYGAFIQDYFTRIK
ncbi:MAG TPA: hypothetical protein VK563_00215 [Puia sp.]|nr:hypothetical protein [Puia sp.]